MIIQWVILVVVWLFAISVIFGAPYLPTLRKTTEQAITMLDLKEGETLVDLGAGDGAVMVIAARAGLRVVGYEINPLLYLVARLRLLPYGKRAKVYCRNYWNVSLPAETKGIYVFLHTRFMDRLDQKLQSLEFPVKVVSYTFKIPNKKVIHSDQALYLYHYNNK